jgi:sterol desaturase/sphingolipid hydroxylase (fatty acid hydroxylase superfamily)
MNLYQINYITFAIPAFFLFLYIEYVISRKRKKTHRFKYERFISNVSIGIAERLLNLFIAGSFFSLFNYIYVNYAIFEISSSWWVWILLLLITDLIWYWYHRLGHEINFLWAAHIVHHQSEEFNLGAAARITTIQALVRNSFWCLLPFLGFDPLMVVIILTVHGVYSFFTHTQLIGKIPWLEKILITPSLHGVHHASDEKYLDKNYGDVFVFWDKIFGTFQAEEEPPRYGLTHPLLSYSFLWQHFHYYFEIAEACRRVKGFKTKLKIIFGSPALLDQDIRPQLEERMFKKTRNKKLYLHLRKYLNIQIGFLVVLLMFITAFFVQLSGIDRFFILSLSLITLINCGALLEQRKWICYLEYSRLLMLVGYVLWKIGYIDLLFIPVMVLMLLEKRFALSGIYNRYVLRVDSTESTVFESNQ